MFFFSSVAQMTLYNHYEQTSASKLELFDHYEQTSAAKLTQFDHYDWTSVTMSSNILKYVIHSLDAFFPKEYKLYAQ
jgi:hypothetical protein